MTIHSLMDVWPKGSLGELLRRFVLPRLEKKSCLESLLDNLKLLWMLKGIRIKGNIAGAMERRS